MKQIANLKLGDSAAVPHQRDLTPPFQFGGPQQNGSKDRLKGKKVLIYGAGDVWYKFMMAPLLHLGIKPEDITLVDLADKPVPEGLEWQYKGVNVINRKEFDKQIAADKDYIKKQGFAFSVVATPPSAHASCAEEAIKNGLPVFIEKPMFASTAEYDTFVAFCKKNNGHVYAIDWQRSLSTLLYSALGQSVPFADSIEYGSDKDKALFDALAGQSIEKVSARFVEGRGNALADISHRGHLAKTTLNKDKWASAGMCADMGIHPKNGLTGAGFILKKITDAFFGGTSDEKGYRTAITQNADGTAPEMYSRVQSMMSFNGQENIPVEIECGKGSAPNVNDGRTIVDFKNGKRLVHEFGHKTNNIILYDTDKKTEIARACDRGEPYERMFLEGNALFNLWPKNQAQIAYGAESREAIKIVEEAHSHACNEPSRHQTARQLALDEMEKPKDAGEKSESFKVAKIGNKPGQCKFTTVSPEEVINGSCQRHSTAENAVYDEVSGNFYYVDIEHGLLTQYNPSSKVRKTWKLATGGLGDDGRPEQMISMVKVNAKDGSIMVMLSGDGEKKNAGLHYFDPEKGELTHVGKVPAWEKQHEENRFNDETTLNIGGKSLICYGTMSKHWDKRYDAKSRYKREGAFYVMDPTTLESHKLTFSDPNLLPPIITNGLADGGDAGDGKRYLFWSETVEDPGMRGAHLNVYRGVLDPKNWSVSNIESFKNFEELGGMMNGVETFGRPDGAKMAKYNGRDVYGISMLELGEIRFFYSDPKDKEYKKEALRIELPKGMTRNTQFALGEDKTGHPIGLVTTQDSGHFARRWSVVEGARTKAKDGLNGSVIAFDLPKGLEAHPDSIKRVDYPSLKQARSLAEPPPSVVPLSGHAQVTKAELYEQGRAR